MNTKLRNILSRQLKTSASIDAAFDLCSTIADIHEVINRIPEQFGEFKVLDTAEDYTYFVIQNLVNFQGKELTHVSTHEFYKIGGVLK